MAEESAQRLSHFDEVELDEVERTSQIGSSRPSITEVALEHAAREGIVIDLTSADQTPSIDSSEAPTERISIDLVSPSLHGPTDLTIDVTAIREFPTIPDFGTLVPMHRQLAQEPRTTKFEEVAPLTSVEPTSATLPTLGIPIHPDQPLGGLASATRFQRLVKRAIDIVVASIALIVLAPFMLIIAALIKATSPGPVLYRSTRIKRGGETFRFFKFRSMYDGAASDLAPLEAMNEQTGPAFKIKSDPRIIPFGRFLRKGSIDELPQLLHVLSGSMSLVGPRPALAQEVAQYDGRTRQRLLVKPGLTCIWQVSGRSDVDFDTWVHMDLEYIRDWSLPGDLALLVRTVPAVVRGRGAY